MTIKRNEINNSLIELKGIYFVYYLLDKESVIYIGSTQNIYHRLKDHRYMKYYHTKQYKFLKQFDSVKMVSFDSEINAKRFERYELNRLKPEYNIFGIKKYKEPQIKGTKKDNLKKDADILNNPQLKYKIQLINKLNRN